ncbi:MAG TPA: hypothetical protein VMD25_00240 [Acidobacteriaceae bacterium]|nr:hypothetical protein [Acidobacteriaceae bacterium]
MSAYADSAEDQRQSRSRRGLRMLGTGLLIAGSALFGGLAVALWDRKSLAKLRQPSHVPQISSSPEDATLD